MAQAGGQPKLGTRLVLLALVVSLCVTGGIAIGTLLFAEFDETAGRILATTGLLSLASLLSLPAGVLLDRRRVTPLAWGTIAAATFAFVLAMITIWGQQEQETLSRLTWTLWLGAGAGAQAATMTALLRPGDSRRLRIVYAVSILLASSLAALIGLAVWIEPDSEAYGRVTGAVAVAAVLATLLQPILRRMEAPAAKRHELVLTLDEPPSEEAVAAAVEALEKHGSRVEKVVGPRV
jgi:drug/metabolite transporter (DMT)-like permease